MPNLQIKNIDEGLYQELKSVAVDENRSVSQQVVFVIRNYLAQRVNRQSTETAAQTLLDIAGSWDDSRTAEEIIKEIKSSHRP
jgi:plasmid stability protein